MQHIGQKKSQIGYSQEESSVSFWAALIGAKLRLSDLLLTARRLASNTTAHRFFEKSRQNRVAVQDVLTNAQTDRRVNWCRRHLLFDFTKGIFSDDYLVLVSRTF